VAPFADEPRWLIGALQGCLSWADRRAEARDWRSGCKGLVSAAYRWRPGASQSAEGAPNLPPHPASITIFPGSAASRGVVAAHKSRIIIGAPPVPASPSGLSVREMPIRHSATRKALRNPGSASYPCQGGSGRPRVVPACGGPQARLARARVPAPGSGSLGSG
jgi:hypothetical protein